MFPAALVLGLAIAYLLLLFAVALFAERSWAAGGTWMRHPVVYGLALGTYFTSWGYFTGGAALFMEGLGDLYTTIGASLTFLVGWPLILKVIRIAKQQRVTTVPEMLALRYGSSFLLTLLVTLLLVLGTVYYVALQLAVISRATRDLILGPAPTPIPVSGPMSLELALVLAVFAILFGARRADTSQGNVGLTAVLAMDALVSLITLLPLALMVCLAFPGLFQGQMTWPSLEIGGASNSYPALMSYMLIGVSAVILLPRMFQVAVVECANESQLRLARWFFPLQMLLLTAAAGLVAWVGASFGFSFRQLPEAALILPFAAGLPAMALFAYIGGLSASAAMISMSYTAVTNILMTSFVIPAMSGLGPRLRPWLLPIRWVLIVLLAIASWLVQLISRVDYLNQFGFLALIATAQVAPAFFLGLTWPRLRREPVTWGLAAATVMLLYTGGIPTLVGSFPALQSLMTHGPWGLAFLRPTAMFGLTSWDANAHAFFWSMAANAATILVMTLRMPVDRVEEARVRALLEGEPGAIPNHQHLQTPIAPGDVQEFLSAFMGEERAQYEARNIQSRIKELDLAGESRQLMLRSSVERVLRGPLGHDAASRVMQDRFPVTEQILPDVMEAFQELEETLQASEEELARRVRELSFLNEAAEILVTQAETGSLTNASCKLIQDEFHLEHVAIFLADGTTLRNTCGDGFALPMACLEVPPGTTLAEAIRLRESRLVRAGDAGSQDDPLLGTSCCREVAYVPIVFEKDLLGVLAVGVKTQAVHLSDAFLRVMGVLANELAIALSNATLLSDLEHRVTARTDELARERDRLAQANEKLSKAIDDLRNLDRLKGAFLNAVSHDLRIPLTGILGYAEFLEDQIGGKLTPAQLDYAHQITEQAYRMTGLLNELLDFARMEAGKFKIDPRPITYAEPLNSAVNTFRPAMQKKQQEVKVAIAPDLPLVFADPERVIQILSNLLSNAVKFTPEGGCITVRAYPEGSQVVTEVSDTGIGIAPEDLPHMFERFFQTEAGKSAGGTGLGLSITKSLVEAHGGTIEVMSQPGKGSTFRFTLPAAKTTD
ncbi:Signal transduction histidine-protein kinase BarA [compost metagenome]